MKIIFFYFENRKRSDCFPKGKSFFKIYSQPLTLYFLPFRFTSVYSLQSII